MKIPSRTGTAFTGNDGVLCLDCDSRRAVGPTKTIRGVFWTQLDRLERLGSLSAIRERSFYVGWVDVIFGQNEDLSTPQVPPTVVTARAGGVRWAIVVAS
jgi:hypothetical protein